MTEHQKRAKLLRKFSNSKEIETKLREAVRTLAKSGIPSLVVGGYAVQEHEYPRYTADIDLVVPNVEEAWELVNSLGPGVPIHLFAAAALFARAR